MHRTLFSPSMVETFRSCKRAYEIAFSKYADGNGSSSAAAICRKFILKGIAEINTTGGYDQAMVIAVDPLKLPDLGYDMNDIAVLLARDMADDWLTRLSSNHRAT